MKRSRRSNPNLVQLSSAESDDEFGLSGFKQHIADNQMPILLADWSAQDFANIYVRFKPHLERQARRFLSDHSQAEEVVQDAFLYLMTSLPELDSELGVLKFLRWKVRMLCLDIAKSAGNSYNFTLEEVNGLAAASPELSDALERADDSAVVALALSKLSPRQRSALVAVAYEEKTTRQIADSMGLSENAARQLLLRARRAFKVALVGEAQVAGLQISEILSLAAKRAANPRSFLAVGLVVALSIFVSGVNTEFTTEIASDSRLELLEHRFSPNNGSSGAGKSVESRDWISSNGETVLQIENGGTRTVVQLEQENEIEVEQNSSDSAPTEGKSDLLSSLLTTKLAEDLSVPPAYIAYSQMESHVTVESSSGLSAHASLDLRDPNNPAKFLYFTLRVQDHILTAVPKRTLTRIEPSVANPGGTSVFIGAMDFVIGDFGGSLNNLSSDATEMLRIGVTLQLDLDADGIMTNQPVLRSSLLG